MITSVPTNGRVSPNDTLSEQVRPPESIAQLPMPSASLIRSRLTNLMETYYPEKPAPFRVNDRIASLYTLQAMLSEKRGSIEHVLLAMRNSRYPCIARVGRELTQYPRPGRKPMGTGDTNGDAYKPEPTEFYESLWDEREDALSTQRKIYTRKSTTNVFENETDY